MKAITYDRYGSPDVLKLTNVAQPIPDDDQVSVEVYASSINAADWHLLTADIFLVRLSAGIVKPKNPILGCDIAGRVMAVGKNVKQFQLGDAVFGAPSVLSAGGFAEYVNVPASALALKPSNLTFEEAAAVPLAAITALQGLRDVAKVQAGQRVLIHGASGGVGTFAVQIAKWLEAEVTAVCSTRNIELMRSLGADYVIDYTQQNFTQNEQRYDVILAVNGYHAITAYKRALSTYGRYVMVGGKMAQMFQALLFGSLLSEKRGRTLHVLTVKCSQKDLQLLTDLVQTGKLKPSIDHSYALDEVPEAMRHFGQGHTRGKIVVRVHPDSGRV